MMKSNIVLIGMPGVGKSSAGVVLAKALGYHFIDSDLVIQQQTGKLLCEIIKESGNDGFLEIEDKINASIMAEKSIIATGGSVIYGENAMKHFKEIGTILYLRASYETISSRLTNLKERGVAMNNSNSLLDLYNERCILYEKYADIIVDVDGMTIEETIHRIKKICEK